jgi:uncharacterized repeat protein (TIGR01451 family)
VDWLASDADGDPLLSTVLYSADGGGNWQAVALEETVQELDVPLAAHRSGHRVRVLVSDGARSSSHEIGFELELEESADLGVTASTSPDPAAPGRELRYELVVRNDGPTDASQVALAHTLPQAARFVAASPGCAYAAGAVLCDLAVLPADSQASRSIVVAVDPSAVGPLASEAAVSAREPDPEPSNDRLPLLTPVCLDSDGDTICDDGDASGVAGDGACAAGATTGCDDNCAALANPMQENQDGDLLGDACDNCPFYATGNVADADGDGRGDECECSDQNGDGQNTVSDLLDINLAVFDPDRATPLCDGNGDGQCDVRDIIAANIEIFSPGSTSTCSRQPVPGP